MTAAFLILFAYLAGSIPFGFLIAHLRGIDIRKHGSGNIGATNVGRVLGRKWGGICFGLDVLKGLLPTLFAGWWLGLVRFDGGPIAGASTAMLFAWLGAMAATVVGHMFPVWLGFKGGKGVATGFGALLGVWPVLTFAAIGAMFVWLTSVRLCRMVGISSVLAAVCLPVFVGVQPWIARSAGSAAPPPVWPFFVVACTLAAVVIVKHRTNIARTIAGTEPKIGRKPAGQTPPAG